MYVPPEALCAFVVVLILKPLDKISKPPSVVVTSVADDSAAKYFNKSP